MVCVLFSGSTMVDLAAAEEEVVEETAAGWRSPETTGTGLSRQPETNALNSESAFTCGSPFKLVIAREVKLIIKSTLDLIILGFL